MADLAGIGLGAVSLLVQAVSSCVSTFNTSQTAEGTGEDILVLKARLRCAAALLKSRKLEWGMDRNLHIYDLRMLEYAPIAVEYIEIIHFVGRRLEVIDRCQRLQQPSGAGFWMRLASLAGSTQSQRSHLQDDILRIGNEAGVEGPVQVVVSGQDQGQRGPRPNNVHD